MISTGWGNILANIMEQGGMMVGIFFKGGL